MCMSSLKYTANLAQKGMVESILPAILFTKFDQLASETNGNILNISIVYSINNGNCYKIFILKRPTSLNYHPTHKLLTVHNFDHEVGK